ncbi:hypothetical protein Q5H92_10735 [Hymenobacter sp. M29]|uniref:Uncharacterized protein n=1 Tax=Hymenobacter mellowenesis TaxID=3063995 RepID=A0ABT9AAI8_9BACT|nr:hypothetical protein [Hymenobacter sp. M29]MDO7846834.1 hypothetical protein [Hymenobacter sp. M29]
MPAITSLESLDRAIQQVSGTHKVLEALWEGDTQGWYLCLSVYAEQGIWPVKRTVCHPLGTVTLGSDLRLFTGQVPPWPEAELVKTFVQQTQRTYGLTLYLPSEEPDDECPRWTERAHARACADCGKLGFPSDSPYLPKDVCYRCHLRREQNARIRNEAACDDGVNLYVYKDGVHRSLGYATHFDSFAIAPYVDPARLPAPLPGGVHVVTLEKEALVDIHARLTADLTEQLSSYEPAEKDARKSHFYHFEEINYQGVAYELEVKLHRLHRDISRVFHAWAGTQQAIADGASYWIYFKRGITHRDDAVLRYLNYPTPSPKRMDQVVQHYHGILTEQEVSRTLAKLEAMHCLERVGRDVTISQTGSNIV